MHAPERIEPTGLSDYLAVMSRSVFEPGLNWHVVEAKWPGIVEAFEGFDPMRVAAYTPEDVERLLGDPRVIRNRAKIEAIVHNAGEMLALEGAGGGFRDYLRSGMSYDEPRLGPQEAVQVRRRHGRLPLPLRGGGVRPAVGAVDRCASLVARGEGPSPQVTVGHAHLCVSP